LNRARAEVGLDAVAHPLDQVRRAGDVLVLTSAAFDLDAPARLGNVLYCGPELADPAWAAGAPSPPGDGPLVVVAFSTTYQGHEGVLARVIEAVAALGLRAVVTLGPALRPEDVRAPASIAVVQHASHSALFPRARLVVTHGGHGTVLRALAAGVPLLVLPMGRDQGDNAARVVYAGAGASLSSHSSAARIRRAVERLLADEATLAGARRMAAVIAADGGRDRAVEALEAL
jgi:UDP:flavonoid glycosyltransferase YjiC (YdhE family)